MPLLERTGNVDFAVESGELVSVLGAPGSGKTQLALELAFLRRPSEGEVLFRGENPVRRQKRLQLPQRPHEIALLVQNAEDQLFARTVFDDVAFGPRHLHQPDDEIERRVDDALRTVRLNPFEVRERSPFALSGGERRRVALAGVLAMQPEVLILDEPTASLDPRTRNEFLDLLAPLQGRTAVVWLTASAREAALAQRVYLLHDGAAAEVAGGSGLLRDWRALERAGVELPSIYQLAAALERRGCSVPDLDGDTAMRTWIVERWKEAGHDR